MSKTGYVYMLVCSDVNIKGIYVGSTRDDRQRKKGHKHSCNNENHKNYNQYVYQYIRQHGGWENWSMIRLEQIQYNDRAELNTRERHWIEQKHAELNRQVPTRTHREYYEANKSEIKEQMKEYYEEHKEKIKDYDKQYRETHKEQIQETRSKPYTCECGRTLRTDNKSGHIKSKVHTNYLSSLSEAAAELVEPISITS